MTATPRIDSDDSLERLVQATRSVVRQPSTATRDELADLRGRLDLALGRARQAGESSTAVAEAESLVPLLTSVAAGRT